MIEKILTGKLKLLPVILILTALALIGVFFIGYTKGYFSGFLPASYADFSVSQGKINVKFSINEKDRINYEAFLKKTGATPVDKMVFQLDQKSTRFLSALSPQRITLTFIGDRDLKFQSKGLPTLPSALFGKSYNFATKSGTLFINYRDEKDYRVRAKEPSVLLNEATKSGKLYISKEFANLFPIASKIATIEISVDGGAVNGEIKLQ